MALMRPEIWADDAVAPRLADQFYGLLPTSTPAAPTTGSTIATNDGSGNPIPSARLNPAGNITASVLQVGLYDGQRFEARNVSTHTITFDTNTTSNVADGATCVIAASTVCLFVWDSVLTYWMHAGL